MNLQHFKGANFPLVSFGFIALCALFLPFRSALPFVPAELSQAISDFDPAGILAALLSMFTYMFLHFNFGHFFGNVFFLFMLGPSIELAVGRKNFALFILACGFGGAFLQWLLGSQGSAMMPVIGASGVVLGLVSVWFIAAPKAVIFEIPILRIPVHFFWVAAVIFWTQIKGLLFGAGLSAGDTTAYFVHVGGALAACLLWTFWLSDLIRAQAALEVAVAGQAQNTANDSAADKHEDS